MFFAPAFRPRSEMTIWAPEASLEDRMARYISAPLSPVEDRPRHGVRGVGEPHHVGWGHSSMSAAVCFARRVCAGMVLLFHHDPLPADDALDRLRDRAVERWSRRGGESAQLELAAVRREIALGEPIGSSAR